MSVLLATLLPVVVIHTWGGIAPPGEDGQHQLATVMVMALAHLGAGYVSWSCRSGGWGFRLLWAVALMLHTFTYPRNWDFYTALPQPDLVVISCILIPTILMYAGPFRSLLDMRGQRGPSDDND